MQFSTSKQYRITLTGASPLLMHKDNISFSEKVKRWQVDPQNKGKSEAGNDRSPAWTWIGYVYHDGKHLGIDSDNIMTMLREGGAKMPTGKGKATFKAATQYGIVVDDIQFDLFVNGKQLTVDTFNELIGNNDFFAHEEFAEKNGFELFVKRARIGQAKHVRVRPMFRNWTAVGTLTVLDEEQSQLKQDVLQRILDIAGCMCGLGDWRPSSKTPGSFGKFTAKVEPIK